MGNSLGISLSHSKNQLDINLNDYTLAQERNDERFGHVYLMKAKSSNATILVKEKLINQYEIRRDEVTKHLDLSNDYLLKIYNVKQGSSSDEYQIFFEDFVTDLDKEIQRHLNERTRFSEGELYSILYCTASALSAFELKGLAHGAIIPVNLLHQSKQVYKTHDNYLLANRSTIYEYALRDEYLRYLAPELIDSYAKQQKTPDLYNANKVDIWCLGVALLDAGLLTREGEFLNRKLNIFDEGRLKDKLKQFKEIYSPQMGRILEDLLALDPTRRPDASTLVRRLPGKPISKTAQSSGKKPTGDKSKNASPVKSSEVNSLNQASNQANEYLRTPLEVQNNQNPLTYSTLNFAKRDLSTLNISSSIKNDPILSKYLDKIYGGESSTVSTGSAQNLYVSQIQHVQQISNSAPTTTVVVQSTTSSSSYVPNPDIQKIIAEIKAQKSQSSQVTQIASVGPIIIHESSSAKIETIGRGENPETPRAYQTKALASSGIAQSLYGGYTFFNTNAEEKQFQSENLASIDSNREKIDQIFLRALTRTNENLRKSQELSSLISATNQSLYISGKDTIKSDWRINTNSYFDDKGALKSTNSTGEKFFTSTDREVARLRDEISKEIAHAESVKKEFASAEEIEEKPKPEN